jgi:UDP:flavonoid glycosyltransferase YjiC (YdhE family)
MRVVFMPAPAIGHSFPLVPLAWALRSAGHDVTFVTGGDGLTVTQAGLAAVDALPGRTTLEMLSGFVRDLPELFAPFTGPPVDAQWERKPAIVASWDPYVDAHVESAVRLEPDLVVYDPIFGVGPLVAAKLGVPAVAHATGFCQYPPEMLRDLPAAVAFRRHGVRVPEGIETIQVAPSGVTDGPPSKRVMRYVPYNGGATLPDWLLGPPERPRVAVTIGTMLPKVQGFGSVERLLAIADIDAEFVVTLGDDPMEPPGDLPPNVRTTGWVPLHALLPTCSAVIHHGGDGTAMTSCALGVPQMIMPNGPERHVNAELLRARGAAHVVDEESLTAEAIAGLLDDDGLRTAAKEIHAEISARPAPADLVPWLADLARTRGGR